MEPPRVRDRTPWGYIGIPYSSNVLGVPPSRKTAQVPESVETDSSPNGVVLSDVMSHEGPRLDKAWPAWI